MTSYRPNYLHGNGYASELAAILFRRHGFSAEFTGDGFALPGEVPNAVWRNVFDTIDDILGEEMARLGAALDLMQLIKNDADLELCEKLFDFVTACEKNLSDIVADERS